MNVHLESEHIREVFAHYGLALYQAQCLEKEIGILLSGPHAPTPDRMTRWRYDDLLDTNFELTFGQLISKIRDVADLPFDIEQKLRRAVIARNWLVHNYWWDRAGEFTTALGREKMLVELSEFIALFEGLDTFFTAAGRKWGLEKGISQEVIDAEMAKYLSGITPPKQQRRKLQKTEMLINVYFYTSMGEDGEKATPLLELADHTLWSLCDCGLTYGPAEVDTTYLRPAPEFQKALPAEINPRPKGATDWNYRIRLSTGFYIEVSSVEHNREFKFRWGLRKARKR